MHVLFELLFFVEYCSQSNYKEQRKCIIEGLFLHSNHDRNIESINQIYKLLLDLIKLIGHYYGASEVGIRLLRRSRSSPAIKKKKLMWLQYLNLEIVYDSL